MIMLYVTLSLFLWSFSQLLLWPLQTMCVMHSHYPKSNHLRYRGIWYEALWKTQARSLDPVAHPRAIQLLDQNTEVRLKDNYYVASLFLRPINLLRNYVILLWNHDIPSPIQIHLYFQWVRSTRNIMHVTSHRRALKRHTICGNRPWIDTRPSLTNTPSYQSKRPSF